MSAKEGFKAPAITVQGFILATDTLVLPNNDEPLFIFISMVLVFTIISFQAFNKRFYLYFPINTYTGQRTIGYDTYLLWALTSFAIMFMLAGIFPYSFWLIFLTIFFSCLAPPVVWSLVVRDKISKRFLNNAVDKEFVFETSCPEPNCRGTVRIVRKVNPDNTGVEIRKCNAEHCPYEKRIDRKEAVFYLP